MPSQNQTSATWARGQKHYARINVNEIDIIFKPMYLVWKQVEQWACKVSTCGHTLAANTKKLQFFFAQTRWNVSWWKSWAIIQAILWISYFVRQKSRFIFLRQTQCMSKHFWSCIRWMVENSKFHDFFIVGKIEIVLKISHKNRNAT